MEANPTKACNHDDATGFIHLIGIAVPADTMYRAITTEDGISAWWTTAV